MILIITYKEDYTADFLIEKLNRQGKKYLRLNTEEIDKHIYELTNQKDFSFLIDGIGTFNGIWFRRLKLPDFQTELPIAAYLASEYDFLFSNLLRNIHAKHWMSAPDALYRAENKIIQLKLANALGFNVPDTLLTNNKKRVKEFVTDNELSGVVIKPLFSGRIESESHVSLIYTNELDNARLNSLERFDLTPCIFQKKILKEYEVRVTIIGNKIFAARVNSQEYEETKIDWRRERLKFVPYNLPYAIANKCIDLVDALNISFGAIDLIKSTDGNYYFLEINPNGQWAWIEIDTGMLISQAIIDFLYG